MGVRHLVLGLAAVGLAACGDFSADQITGAATDAAAGAAKMAAQFVDTRTACIATGQDEAFCGCLSARLGERLAPEQIDALATVVHEGLTSGMQAAAASATTIDPATREAVVNCAASSALGAEQAEAGGRDAEGAGQ